MKKFIQILVITLTMLFVSAVPTYAADCSVGIDNVSVDGALVTFDVCIENNPGLATGKIIVKFDNTVFEPYSVTQGDVLSSVYSFSSDLDDNNTDLTIIDQFSVAWMNISNISGDGALFSCSFYVKDSYTSDQTITLEASQFANEDAQLLTVSTADGIIPAPEDVDDDGGDGNDTETFEVTVSQNALSKSDMTVSGSVSAAIYCVENAPSSATVILGIYDSGNRLIGIKYVETTLSAGVNSIEFTDVSASGNVQGNYYAKIFTWSSLNDMSPLTDNVTTFTIK